VNHHHDRDHHDDDDDRNEELLTLADVAALLRIPPATLRYWRHLGAGPRSFRLGKHVRYYRRDVATWLRSQRNAGGAETA
jgi:predicted DNA-binding transcriptional regulator AlpA